VYGDNSTDVRQRETKLGTTDLKVTRTYVLVRTGRQNDSSAGRTMDIDPFCIIRQVTVALQRDQFRGNEEN